MSAHPIPLRTFKDVTKALQSQFSAPKIPLSLPAESRRMLQTFIDENDGKIGDEEYLRNNQETLKVFWEKHVGATPRKSGAFAGVLKELRPILPEEETLDWYRWAIRPVITSTEGRKPALEDAREYLIGCMVYDEDDDSAHERVKTTNHLLHDLLAVYTERSRSLTEDDQYVAKENAIVLQHVENVLIAFGRKRPKELFNSIDDLVTSANTRLQAFTLLSSFLRHQTPHLYLVANTPLFEHLLKSLMNDTSTTVTYAALTSLVMLLPHIPGSLAPYLPRLFLIYSRLLCWEKFSSLSDESQKNLVTDNRIANEDSDDEGDNSPDEIGIDPTWEVAKPPEGTIESSTPELMTYFTYLYGLYPLNFASYIRKPRKYLKSVDFPRADAFDLDQAVIRTRTEQFRQVHLLHPNFYNMTVEEELIDPKWPKMDPADVVGDCLGLFVKPEPSLPMPGPPPSGKLPDLPPLPPIAVGSKRLSGAFSPVMSHMSFRSASSWRDTQSTAVSVIPESPTHRSQGMLSDDEQHVEYPRPITPKERSPKERSVVPPPSTNVEYLQQQVTLLRNDLNFEKWHKAQISQHVSQIMRRNVKEATVEAETLNLINANRALKKQVEQLQKAREATIKDSALTRKQANTLEANMTERFTKLKTDQETWQTDADELQKLRTETKSYRDLLVQTEARELTKSHELEIALRELDELKGVQDQLQKVMHKLHEYEYREFEFDAAVRERDLLKNEKEMLTLRVSRHEEHRERMRQAYAERISELESQNKPDPIARRLSIPSSSETQALIERAVKESENRLTQLKKAHGRLLEKYTDLEMQNQDLQSRLDALEANGSGHTFFRDTEEGPSYGSRERSFNYDLIEEYSSSSDGARARTSTAEQIDIRNFRPAMPILPTPSPTTVHSSAGLTFEGPAANKKFSFISNSSGLPMAVNQSAPLSRDETKSSWSENSSETKRREKIKPDSTVRVYGRGGAQNIKLKQKVGTLKDLKESKEEKENGTTGVKKLGLKGLRLV